MMDETFCLAYFGSHFLSASSSSSYLLRQTIEKFSGKQSNVRGKRWKSASRKRTRSATSERLSTDQSDCGRSAAAVRAPLRRCPPRFPFATTNMSAASLCLPFPASVSLPRASLSGLFQPECYYKLVDPLIKRHSSAFGTRKVLPPRGPQRDCSGGSVSGLEATIELLHSSPPLQNSY